MVESKGGAIGCMLLALLFLGTWPAVLTLLERRGRLPQHTYLDYSITNLLAALIIAVTFGEIGKSTPNEPNFFAQLAQVTRFHCILQLLSFAGIGPCTCSCISLSSYPLNYPSGTNFICHCIFLTICISYHV